YQGQALSNGAPLEHGLIRKFFLSGQPRRQAVLPDQPGSTHIYDNGFLTAFKQIAGNLTNLGAVPVTNPIVSIFSWASAAVSAIGSSVFSTGQVGTAANTVDVNNYTKYAAAGTSEYYLRHFPQFSTVLFGNNDGRSAYNSLQVRLQRQFGALRVAANFTWSKAMDNDLST